MKPTTVHLGFEVPSGEPVSVPIMHMCVTGQTQSAGKTTTLEAMVSRSGLKAIAFVTKRGEGAFSYMRELAELSKSDNVASFHFPRENPDKLIDPTGVTYIKPYFRHRADWQFVSDILGAILSEKLKFQRPWIIQVCRGAKTLDDVRRKVLMHLHGDKAKKIRPATGMAQGVYTELEAYFDLLLPEIEALPYTDKLELKPGLNVMDLSAYSTPLQMLVVSAVLEWIYKHETGVITVIPEAWEFVPAKRNSPAKSAAISLIRKGGALRNFIWADAQDLSSMDTEIRRAFGVWILGVQREQNEVKRVLSHIPSDTSKPKADDIMHLEKGQFFVCHGREIKKAYVQPVWMSEGVAYTVAKGECAIPSAPSSHAREIKKVFDRHKEEIGRELAKPPSPLEQHLVSEYDSLAEWAKGRDFSLPDLSVGDPIVAPDNTPKPEDYQTMSARLPHLIDDGTVASRKAIGEYHQRQSDRMAVNVPKHYSKVKEQEMDQHEREQYVSVIADLRREVQQLKNRLGIPLNLDEIEKLPHPDDSTPFTQEEVSRGPCVETAISHSAVAHEIMKDAFFVDKIVREVVGRIPSNGTIKVEPREVVLKEFQQAEVARILETAENRSPWQKQVIRFIEAQGKPFQKAALVTNILGRKTVNMQRDFKDQYAEIDELVALGFLWKDPKNGVYPNMGVAIKRRLEVYDPSDADVDNIIGQVMLKLK